MARSGRSRQTNHAARSECTWEGSLIRVRFVTCVVVLARFRRTACKTRPKRAKRRSGNGTNDILSAHVFFFFFVSFRPAIYNPIAARIDPVDKNGFRRNIQRVVPVVDGGEKPADVSWRTIRTAFGVLAPKPFEKSLRTIRSRWWLSRAPRVFFYRKFVFDPKNHPRTRRVRGGGKKKISKNTVDRLSAWTRLQAFSSS